MALATTVFSLAMQTRMLNKIENQMNCEIPWAGIDILSNDQKKDHPNAYHRPTKTSLTYNCHGLTFGARRTWIERPSQVQSILDEDGYKRITTRPVTGDVAIYRNPSSGDIEHSGIVIAVEAGPFGKVKVLSKWGSSHEVIHETGDSPYDAGRIEYYRIER